MTARMLPSADPAPTIETSFKRVQAKFGAEDGTNGTAAAQDTVEALQ